MKSKGRVIRTGLFLALVNFAAAAALGLILRYNLIFPVEGITVRYWIHGHSHTAFLGWIFTALATLAYALMLPKSSALNKNMYRIIIWSQVAVTGMLVTFPMMGYAALSILFSTFHMVLSFIFVSLFFRNSPKKVLAVRMMKAALIFMLVSGAGPLALGPIMVSGFKGTPMYDMAIYFYLHFQYNGWFTLAVFSLLIKLADDHGIEIKKKNGKIFYRLMVFSAILTLALSALGFNEDYYSLAAGMVGAVLQLFAGGIVLKFIFTNRMRLFSGTNAWVRFFLILALLSWFLKIIMQFASGIPAVTVFAYVNREAIMTYLHLTFLGFTSCALYGIFIRYDFLSSKNLRAKAAYGIFSTSAVLMLVTVGLKALPQLLSIELFQTINYVLFAEALLLLIGIAMILFYGFVLPTKRKPR